MSLRAALVLAAGLAACDGTRHETLVLDMSFLADGGVCENVVGGAACADIDSCPLDCSAEVVLRVVDSSNGRQYGKQCRRFAAEDDRRLRALPGLLTELVAAIQVPADRNVDVELAVYSPALDTDPCPTTSFNRSPPESVTMSAHRPGYHARAVDVRLGSSPVAELLLECGELRSQCDVPRVDVVTRVFGLQQGTESIIEPGDLTVRLAQLVIAPSVTFQTLTAAMMWNGSESEPRWTSEIGTDDVGPPCLATLVQRVAGDAVLSCQSTFSGGSAATTGIEIDNTTYDRLVAELGAPTGGLFVGRVVTSTGNPVEGASIRPLARTASATVVYLDDELRPSAAGVTSAEAWVAIVAPPSFPYRDAQGEMRFAPCCGYFEVERGEERGCSRGPIGQVKNVMTAGFLELGLACPGE